jgi:hypothetical protein
MVATLKRIEPINALCYVPAGSLEVTQHLTFSHISHLLSITLHEAYRTHQCHQEIIRVIALDYPSSAQLWKGCLAAGLLKMSSSSWSVRYRMVSNKDDLLDSEINQVETGDHDADLVPKSRLSGCFNQKRNVLGIAWVTFC